MRFMRLSKTVTWSEESLFLEHTYRYIRTEKHTDTVFSAFKNGLKKQQSQHQWGFLLPCDKKRFQNQYTEPLLPASLLHFLLAIQTHAGRGELKCPGPHAFSWPFMGGKSWILVGFDQFSHSMVWSSQVKQQCDGQTNLPNGTFEAYNHKTFKKYM